VRQVESVSFFISGVCDFAVGVMAPGPVTASAVALGSRNRYAGVLIGLGHCIIELPLVILLLLGLGAFFKSETAQMLIGLGGGLFLLFMAVQMLREIKKVGFKQEKVISSDPVLAGIMLSGGNPYFPLWWLAVGLNLMTRASEFGVWAIALFALIHWLCDCVWLQILSWASFRGTRILGVNGQRVVLGICGAAMAAFGCLFLWGGGKILLR
jgi:threonine/homoserine/homoserine lactone efflux protein